MGAIFLLVSLALAKSALGQALPGTPAANQLELYLNSTIASGPPQLTLTHGVPVSRADAEQVLNRDFLFNFHALEEITNFNRERIPGRTVHGKGAGALGYFEVTHDVTDISNAVPFTKMGKITPVLARFSSSFSSRGSPDSLRATYGFAAKFYTEEGNWDMLGFTTDTFPIKDPMLFPSSLHASLANPKTLQLDFSALFDILTIRKESINSLLQFVGDMGVPLSYRHISGHSLHTFQVENDKKEISFVRWKMTPDLGERYLNQTEAARMAGARPDYYIEDLYNSIETGEFPTWTFGMQVIPYKDVHKAGFDIFDVTMRWPIKKYPPRPIGKFKLNKNPDNYFRIVELASFNPGNLIPGMQGVDKMFEVRTLAYRDAALYRLGVNFNKIDVNCPINSVNTYYRDGRSPVRDNGLGIVNYYPNSYNGPVGANTTRTKTERVRVYTNPEATNFGQARDYYYGLSEGARTRLNQNFATLLLTTYPSIQARVLNLFGEVDAGMRSDFEAALAAAAANAEATLAALQAQPIQD